MSDELYFDQFLSLNICTASTSNLPSAVNFGICEEFIGINCMETPFSQQVF